MSEVPKDRKSAAHGEAGYERQDNDAYFTPAWVTQALLREEEFADWIWEPSAGAGHIVTPLRAAGHAVIATDIVDYGFALHGLGDFLEPSDVVAVGRSSHRFDLVSNPPYKAAAGYVWRALEVGRIMRGKVALLLPAEYSYPIKRRAFFKGNPHFKAKIEISTRIKWIFPKLIDGVWVFEEKNEAAPRFYSAWYIWDFSDEWAGAGISWAAEKDGTQGVLL